MGNNTKPNNFDKALESSIHEYFISNNIKRKADSAAWLKLWTILIFWFVSLVLIYKVQTTFGGYFLLYLMHGIASLLMIFNISHDAAHQAISSRSWINELLAYSFNLVGGNKYAWYLKHNIGHHKYTNIHGGDIDIETTPFFRVSQYTAKRWYYRFQAFYIVPLYCFMSLLMVFVLDIKVLLNLKPRFNYNHPVNEWIKLLFFKFFYIFYIIILPCYILPISPIEIILCFLGMHALVGLVISLVLLSSHFIENVYYYAKTENLKLPSSWSMHQLLTTADIAPENKFANFLLGGLNANVIHHIFPTVHHCHLIPMVKILKQTAQDFGVPYHSYAYFTAIKLHFTFLKRMGTN